LEDLWNVTLVRVAGGNVRNIYVTEVAHMYQH
jgi:hypothetical protein